MIWESWLLFAVGYCGGVCTVALPLLAPAVAAWWQDYLVRHEFPSFPLKDHAGVKEWQAKNLGLHTYDPDRNHDTRPLKDIAE